MYVCHMVFIFKLYRNKQGKKITLYGENNVTGVRGGGNLTFPAVLLFQYRRVGGLGGGVNLLMLFSKLPKNIQESVYFMNFYIVCLC